MTISTEDLIKSAEKLLKDLTPEETYKLIIDEAIGLMNADYGSVFLESKNVLERVYASDPLFYQIKIRKRGYTYRAFKSNEPTIIRVSKIASFQPKYSEVNAEYVVYIPLQYENKPIGVLVLGSHQKKSYLDAILNEMLIFASTRRCWITITS